ncbi:11149_t:CDS:2 [Paraglomus occultum]|uniref:11149_t:CDS:1 n=1 Tax=Paraglomus occultum TaxID=144539 RepID=A0A9N8ZKW7_9GLOM|nr:11149_t:CDS:2 [Paraglomus occultum]
MHTQVNNEELADRGHGRNLDIPQCFCQLDASFAYSEEFGLLYECHWMHHKVEDGKSEEPSEERTDDNDAKSTEQVPENESLITGNESSDINTKSSKSDYVCGFHVHKDAWDSFLAGEIDPRHPELSVCPYFNYTFCVFFEERNTYKLAFPPTPKCHCGFPVTIRYSHTHFKYMFGCEFYPIDGAKPKCDWHAWAISVAFPKPVDSIHPLTNQIPANVLESINAEHSSFDERFTRKTELIDETYNIDQIENHTSVREGGLPEKMRNNGRTISYRLDSRRDPPRKLYNGYSKSDRHSNINGFAGKRSRSNSGFDHSYTREKHGGFKFTSRGYSNFNNSTKQSQPSTKISDMSQTMGEAGWGQQNRRCLETGLDAGILWGNGIQNPNRSNTNDANHNTQPGSNSMRHPHKEEQPRKKCPDDDAMEDEAIEFRRKAMVSQGTCRNHKDSIEDDQHQQNTRGNPNVRHGYERDTFFDSIFTEKPRPDAHAFECPANTYTKVKPLRISIPLSSTSSTPNSASNTTYSNLRYYCVMNQFSQTRPCFIYEQSNVISSAAMDRQHQQMRDLDDEIKFLENKISSMKTESVRQKRMQENEMDREINLRQSCQRKIIELGDIVAGQKAKIQELLKKMESDKKEKATASMKCRVCFEETITHAVVPCYHLVMCARCVHAVERCCVCRREKEDVVRIYFG